MKMCRRAIASFCICTTASVRTDIRGTTMQMKDNIIDRTWTRSLTHILHNSKLHSVFVMIIVDYSVLCQPKFETRYNLRRATKAKFIERFCHQGYKAGPENKTLRSYSCEKPKCNFIVTDFRY
jgi:hypothetical protein